MEDPLLWYSADRASRLLLGIADRPEPLEGLGAVGRGCVIAPDHKNVVGCSVVGHCAFPLSGRGWVVGAARFDGVVPDELVAGPAADGEAAVAMRLGGSTVVDPRGRLDSKYW